MTNIEIVYSNKRKTICLQVTKDGKVRLLAPAGISFDKLSDFVCSHKDWIDKNLSKMKQKTDIYQNADTNKLRTLAKEYIPKRVLELAKITGLCPENIKITSAKTRFGSCSSKNSLCFSLYLMLYPKEAIDYVIIHELCHIKEKNHSKRFYALVQKYMPDYKKRRTMLRE